jgi:uncharacterized membrane protein (UPF0127 family)
MQLGALFDQNRGRCVVRKVWKAANAWERMRGLLGRARLGDNEALLLEPCSSVHCMGMRYPLDLVYIDRQGRVCKLVYGVKPWRFSASLRAHATLELAAGVLAVTGIRVGDVVAWQEGKA